MRRVFQTVATAAALLLFYVSPVHAASPSVERKETGPLRVDVGLSAWISTGKTTWSHDASGVSSLLGNPSSKLDYKDVAANFVELSAKATLRDRWFARASFGFADIGGGRLVDDDFVSADGAASFGTTVTGAHRFSRTFSNVEGSHSWYVQGEVGGRVWTFPRHRGRLDLFAGFHYWTQRHQATGVTQVECTALTPSPIQCSPAGTVSSAGETVITNTQVWRSIELGLDTEIRLHRRVSLTGRAAFLPVTWLTNEDVHHLRTDLQQNPSFRMTGWGLGAQLEGGASIQILSRLFFDVGYRFWWNQTLDGEWENFPVGGGGVTVPLTQFRTSRQGVTFGLRYAF
ncbi:Pom domain-containing protein [Nitrospira tepida]|uniref:Pom domain-containing protein n=1 Tax=Nitrospira tepida TaxID=2973512 RepID=A0AA86MZC0_9BACT|nr:hypothetical protein [Nitrospira tepida]CAI4031829.1 Pom domain-containing protein [Nitrospira tepida]